MSDIENELKKVIVKRYYPFYSNSLNYNPLAFKSMRYMFRNAGWIVNIDEEPVEVYYPITSFGASEEEVLRSAYEEYQRIQDKLVEFAKVTKEREERRKAWEAIPHEAHYISYRLRELIDYMPYHKMWRKGPLPEKFSGRYYYWSWEHYLPKNRKVDKYKEVRPGFLKLTLNYRLNGIPFFEVFQVKPHYKGSRKLNITHYEYDILELKRRNERKFLEEDLKEGLHGYS